MGAVAEMTIAERVAAVGYDYEAQTFEAVPCNLCGCTLLEEQLTLPDRYGFPVTLCCCECGLSWLSPRLTKEGYADFYARWYRPLVGAHRCQEVTTETVANEAKAYGYSVCPNFAPWLRGRYGKSLLDIGGSTGVVADILADAYELTATVLDPSADELAFAMSRGLRTIHALFEGWQPEGQQWDVVTLFQTIDHLLDIKGALAKVRSLLAPGGVFIFDICEWAATKKWAGCIEQAVKIDHPFYLTKQTTEKFLEGAGLRIVGRGEALAGRKLFFVCEAVT